MTLILRCPCGDFTETGTDIHYLKTQLAHHKQHECSPADRGVFLYQEGAA